MALLQDKNELHLYPSNDNYQYMGAINIDTATLSASTMVVIIDASASMGAATSRFVRNIIPLAMSKLNYPENCPIHLINFSSKTEHRELTASQLKTSDIKSEGGEELSLAIEALRKTLERHSKNSPTTPVRLLTISDGGIGNATNAAKETKLLTDFLATSDLAINSQAIRLFTSNSQPDTKGISYLLQINNTTATKLLDIKIAETDEAIANEIVGVFQLDSFNNYQTLQFETSIVSKFPWDTFLSSSVLLAPGLNIFWLKLVPTGVIKLGGETIKFIVESQLTPPIFHQLMETKLGYIADHMTVLKVVGTTEANGMVDQISSYFTTKEEELATKCSTPNTKVITNLLDGIAKNRTNFRDSAEMAEFLRNTNKEMEKQRQMKEEEERLQREEEERVQREEEERVMKEEEENRLKQEEEDRLKSLDSQVTATKIYPAKDANPTQTVFILDEHACGPRESRHFTEKILPVMLTKMLYGDSQLVHLVTFVRHKTTVADMVHSLLQTLDTSKEIQIFVLTKVNEQQEIDNFAETLIEHMSATNVSYEIQVVRIATSKSPSRKYSLVDIDAGESSESIAKQIAGYTTEKVLSDLHIQNYVEKVGLRNYCSFHVFIAVVIFAILFIRYIFFVSEDD